MTNILQASAQLAHQGYRLSLEDPAACQHLWATAIQHLDPKGLRALAEALPTTGAVAQALRDQLHSLAMERATGPQEVPHA